MFRWYALYTKARKEFQVAEILAAKGVETYVPALTVSTRRRGTVQRAFFPRYTFAQIDFATVGTSAVVWTPGLTNVVTFDGRPAVVPDRIVEHLRNRLAEISERGYAATFQPGERVLILEGPFKDFEAVFDKAMSGSDRVRILLEILGRVARYELDAYSIAHVDPLRPMLDK